MQFHLVSHYVRQTIESDRLQAKKSIDFVLFYWKRFLFNTDTLMSAHQWTNPGVITSSKLTSYCQIWLKEIVQGLRRHLVKHSKPGGEMLKNTFYGGYLERRSISLFNTRPEPQITH